MVRSLPPEPVRRRTFFASQITIQPASNASSASATRASSQTVLAALSPPKDLVSTHKKSRTILLRDTDSAPDPDASNDIPTRVDSAEKRGNKVDTAQNASSSPAEVSHSSSSKTKKMALATSPVDLGSSRARRSAAAVASSNIDAALTGQAKPRQFWSLSGSSAPARAPVPGSSNGPVEVGFGPDDSTITKSKLAATKHRQRIVVTPPPAQEGSSHKSAQVNGKVTKRFMEAGFYCQDDFAKSPHKLVSKVLMRREAESELKSKYPKANAAYRPELNRPAFPPLPYDYGYELFFGEQHDFVLPFNIRSESENGLLDGKKKPAPYSKLRANVYPERGRMTAAVHAVCRCDPESGCGDNCINRIMSYLCGRDCPCGENCTNQSLIMRKTPNVKLQYTGSRGFGLFAHQDVNEGDFVIDYRGEVICLETYLDRCQAEYAASRNFYALAYDQGEVIDAGSRGNEARFINHSCNPNLVVHRFQALGDGLEEYEVGMWASRDISAGEELTYDYNFDAFGVADGAKRVECRCGAPNCVGVLGRKAGEKSAKQIALDMEAEAASRAKATEIRAKRSRSDHQRGSTQSKPKKSSSASSEDQPTAKVYKAAAKAPLRPILPAKEKSKASSKQAEPIAGPSKKASAKSNKKDKSKEPEFKGIMIGGRPVAAKIAECMAETGRTYQKRQPSRPSASRQLVDDEQEAPGGIAIPPPVDFYPSQNKAQTAKNKGKQREIKPKPRTKAASSIPNLTASTTWKIMPSARKLPNVPCEPEASSLVDPPQTDDREPSPVPLWAPRKGTTRKKPRIPSPAASSSTGSFDEISEPEPLTDDLDDGEEDLEDSDEIVDENSVPLGLKDATTQSGALAYKDYVAEPRTLEEWNILRDQQGRDSTWVDNIVAVYGSLPGPGHPGSTGSLVSVKLLAAKREAALAAGINITATKKRKAPTDHGSRRKSEPNRITIKISRKSDSGQKSTSTDLDGPAQPNEGSIDGEIAHPRSARSGTEAREAAVRAKREAIKKRNGAPMGWVYEVVPVVPPALAVQEPEELTRGSRRRHTINYNEGR